MRSENRREQEVSNSWENRERVEVDFGDICRHSSAQVHKEAEAHFRYAIATGDAKLPECKYKRPDRISSYDGDFSY